MTAAAALALAACALMMAADVARAGYVSWLEHPGNPAYDPAAHRAYYPCVLYDANRFSGHGASYYYKMWYGGYSYEPGANYNQAVSYSDDGITWTAPVEVQGITPKQPGTPGGYHAQVVYIPGGYGAGPYYYRIWYWTGVMSYSISDLRTADSVDGVNWVNDQPLTQDATYPLISGITGTDWRRGTYGPVCVFHNPSAGNSGSDPFNYTFAMYYDATTGGQEVVGLAYSSDGVHWTRYHQAPYEDAPVLDHGAPGAWDSAFASFGTVVRESPSVWHFWYSGGQSALHEGIGYASSSDGINWTKAAYNPLLHRDDGVPWRSSRTYTPSVIYSPTQFDGHGAANFFKMWYAGVDSSANYAIGYAERNTVIPVGPARVHTTIQSAIDDAYPGDTILVDPGTYNESLRVNKSLRIVSVDGRDSTVIDGPDSEPYVV